MQANTVTQTAAPRKLKTRNFRHPIPGMLVGRKWPARVRLRALVCKTGIAHHHRPGKIDIFP
jgi:hypothetical protein